MTWPLRSHATLPLAWIAERLNVGSRPGSAHGFLVQHPNAPLYISIIKESPACKWHGTDGVVIRRKAAGKFISPAPFGRR